MVKDELIELLNGSFKDEIYFDIEYLRKKILGFECKICNNYTESINKVCKSCSRNSLINSIIDEKIN
jgi:hypothetical protein